MRVTVLEDAYDHMLCAVFVYAHTHARARAIAHAQGLGTAAVFEWQGWAKAKFFVSQPGAYLLKCSGLHTVRVDGHVYAADQFGTGVVAGAVYLTEGEHSLAVHVRAKLKAFFNCRFVPAGDTLFTRGPPSLPDVYDGVVAGDRIGLPVLNTNPSEYVSVVVELQGLASTDGSFLRTFSAPLSVGPGQTGVAAIPLTPPANEGEKGGEGVTEPMAWPCDTPVTASVTGVYTTGPQAGVSVGNPLQFSFSLRCRSVGQSFTLTYADHDGSVGFAAAIAPRQPCTQPTGCPILLSLHGTGVTAGDSADAYKQKRGSDMAFGFDTVWVCAADRHGAHNWEYTGHHTAHAAATALSLLSQHSGFGGKFRADPSALVYAGHSMGGHGAWVCATLQPDLARGVASIAGWLTKEHYGDSNMIFTLDHAIPYIDPKIKAISEAATAEYSSDLYAGNLVGMPAFLRVGGDDNAVNPWFVRRMARILEAAGVDATFEELPGLGHWWWDRYVVIVCCVCVFAVVCVRVCVCARLCCVCLLSACACVGMRARVWWVCLVS